MSTQPRRTAPHSPSSTRDTPSHPTSNHAEMLAHTARRVPAGWDRWCWLSTDVRVLSCSDSQGDGVSTMVPGSSMNLASMNPSKSSGGLANGAPQNGPVQSHPLTPNATGMVAH